MILLGSDGKEEVSPSWRKWPLQTCLGRVYLPLPIFLFHSAYWPDITMWGISLSHVHATMMLTLAIGSQQWNKPTMDWSLGNCKTKSIFYYFKSLAPGFSHSKERLENVATSWGFSFSLGTHLTATIREADHCSHNDIWICFSRGPMGSFWKLSLFLFLFFYSVGVQFSPKSFFLQNLKEASVGPLNWNERLTMLLDTESLRPKVWDQGRSL